MDQPVNTSGRKQLKRSFYSIFSLNLQHSASSPLTYPHPPNFLLVILERYTPSPLKYFPLTMQRFWQNGPASQHIRKEPAKNEFLVDFCFELTAQHLFSSDLPPSNKSLVDTKKALPAPPPKKTVHQKIFTTIMSYQFYPNLPNHWLIREGFSKMSQPVNMPGRNQLKTRFQPTFALN